MCSIISCIISTGMGGGTHMIEGHFALLSDVLCGMVTFACDSR